MRITRPELENLYRTHGAMVFRRARKLLGTDDAAHEVVQDLFLSLFEKPSQYSGASSLTTFLYSATTHSSLNRLRNESNRTRLRVERASELASGQERPPDQESLAELRSVLRIMPEQFAQICVYYFMDGLTHEEIARILQCSRRHVGDLLARAIAWAEEHAARSSKEPASNPEATC